MAGNFRNARAQAESEEFISINIVVLAQIITLCNTIAHPFIVLLPAMEKARHAGLVSPGGGSNTAHRLPDQPHGKHPVKAHWNLFVALAILVSLLVLDHAFAIAIPLLPMLIISVAAYLLAGSDVLLKAFSLIKKGDFFNEFVLMSVATTGAFLLGEFEEGVAVMVFYQAGEWFQHDAVGRARRSIRALLDVRPERATVLRNGQWLAVHPSVIQTGEVIRVKAGEKVALDGELVSEAASFNTATLSGESLPSAIHRNQPVLAGSINLDTLADIKVTALFGNSRLSRILELVQEAAGRKSRTQLFISRFARVYTPVVFFLALAVVLLPMLFLADYDLRTWFYRSLVFLVISCPCALVISIPLAYFGGIGLASRNGILFKGANFLDVMAGIDTVLMDKTGTLTKGVFEVKTIAAQHMGELEFLNLVAALESHSTHPVATAIVRRAGDGFEGAGVSDVEEIAGFGMRGWVSGSHITAGNLKLLNRFAVDYPPRLHEQTDTLVAVAIDGRYAGYMTIADEVKPDAAATIAQLTQMGIRTAVLSGDKQTVVTDLANAIGIEEAYGDLLPDDKMKKVEHYKRQGRRIAFAGDGVNDAPVIALADAGIAMGGLGSDTAIEIADVVIQNDQPSKIVSAIRIGRITRKNVWQNIVLALAVKGAVLALGAGGIATLWEAVIADVGVALLAILNAVRIQEKKV